MTLATNDNVQGINEELDRIARSRLFSNSARLVRFLRFTVDEVLNGRGDLLKEYLIGTRVYDRPDDYDPRVDSVVRVEARRLRSKLDKYYETAGVAANLRITFRSGSYVPTFVAPADAPRAPDHPDRPVDQKPSGLYHDGEGAGLAIVPFRCVTECAHTVEWVAGLTEELAYRMSNSAGFRVAARNAVPDAHLGGTAASIANGRGIDVFLHGTVRRLGNSYRITAEMYDSAGFVVWSDRFDIGAGNIDDGQERIATAIATRCRLDYSPVRALRVSPSLAAVRSIGLSMRGRQTIDEQAPPAMIDAVRTMTAAVGRAPTCTQLWSALAGCHVELFRRGALEHEAAWEAAKPMADRVLAIDPGSSEGHCAAAGMHGWLRWNWARAATHLRAALDAGDVLRANYLQGLLFSYDGRFDEALGQLRKAAALDPFAQSVRVAIAHTLFLARRYDTLNATFADGREHKPNLDILRYLGLAHVLSGDRDKAASLLEDVSKAVTDSVAHRIVPAELEAWLGRPNKAIRMLSDKQLTCAERASLAVAIGDYPASVAALASARKKRDPIVLSLRFDARFDKLRRYELFESIVDQSRVKLSD
jgi:TolB-like protein/tetratricopeptide (TPR) repeat protein